MKINDSLFAMHRFQFLTAFLLLINLTVTVVLGTDDDQDQQLPNIVLIISDDQSWTDYGFMGHPTIKTPCLDKIAQQGMTFKRGYVPTSLCRPSLATIITGLYPAQHLITGNDPALDTPTNTKARQQRTAQYQALVSDLNTKIKKLDTLPKMLANKGYLSFQSGKWWEGSYQDGGFTHGMTHGDRNRGARHGDDGLKIGRQGLKPIFEFIEQADDRPFFVWYAPFLPHTPHTPPARLLNKYKQPDRPIALAKYYAMCQWLDETCGQLVDFIDRKGLGQQTLILFVADNGWIQRTPQTEVPANWNKNFAPGSKQSPSDGGIRSPILMRWTGKIKPVVDQQTLVSSIDLAPTILAAAGIDKTQAMTGLNLLELAAGKGLDRNSIFGEIYAHDIADINDPAQSLLYRWCVSGDYKLINFYPGKTGRFGALHKPMHGVRQAELFDISNDPHEKTNLFSTRSQTAKALEAKIDAFFARF